MLNHIHQLVRSLNLDESCYTPEIVEIFKSLGNKRVNAILEHSLASFTNIDQQPIPKPDPTSARDIRSRFIFAKYNDKLFCSSEVTMMLKNMSLPWTLEQGVHGWQFPENAALSAWLSESVSDSDRVNGLLEVYFWLCRTQLQGSGSDLVKAWSEWLKQQSKVSSTSVTRFLDLNGISLTD
jgi:hypothetical protein